MAWLPDAMRSVGHQLRREGLLHPGREHQHRQPGVQAAGLDGGPDPLVGEGRRHPHIQDHQVGPVLAKRRQEGVGGPDRGHRTLTALWTAPSTRMCSGVRPAS